MKNYLTQLLSDIETVILERWKLCPPHFYQMGLPDRYLDPPQGWEGPPLGYANEDFGRLDEFFAGLEEADVLSNPLPVEERPATDQEIEIAGDPDISAEENEPNPEFEASIEEVEKYIHDEPVKNMYYHFGFDAEQFPPSDKLTDEELEQLTIALCRLWAAFNFTVSFPQKTPARIVYPLFTEQMHSPTHLMNRGIIGVEFCDYEPAHCPFGEWCNCKDFDDEGYDG